MDILRQSLSATQKNLTSLKEGKEKDLCPVCNYNLFHNEKVTKRIGIINKFDKVKGWLCPHCLSEFDLDSKVVELFGEDIIKGKA